jgi:peptide-methionine (R)-S-oxide reductase
VPGPVPRRCCADGAALTCSTATGARREAACPRDRHPSRPISRGREITQITLLRPATAAGRQASLGPHPPGCRPRHADEPADHGSPQPPGLGPAEHSGSALCCRNIEKAPVSAAEKRAIMQLSESEWQRKLTREQYRVLRQKGTERPFSGRLLENYETGEYACAACGNVVFGSAEKYESHTPGLDGWPSFTDSAPDSVRLEHDYSFFMHRIEVLCGRCGGHLGHLFDDPTSPNSKHYCINSCALDFAGAGAETTENSLDDT